MRVRGACSSSGLAVRCPTMPIDLISSGPLIVFVVPCPQLLLFYLSLKKKVGAFETSRHLLRVVASCSGVY